MTKNIMEPQPSSLGEICGPGLGPFGDAFCNSAADDPGPLNAIASIVSTIIGFITIIAGLFFLFQFIIGALQWISSTGEKNKLQQAQDRITQAFLGLVIVVAAYAVTSIVGSLLGLDNILLGNVGGLLEALQLKAPTQ